MDKVIVLDEKMRRAADLDPAKVINPVTIEDAVTGEHALSFGYPATGPLEPGWMEMTWEDLFRIFGEDITWQGLIDALEGLE